MGIILRQLDSSPILAVTQPVQTREVELLKLDGTLILSGHQPTLLPYPGFFYRMYHSNIMDICPYDPLSRHTGRYQYRVKIGKDTYWRWFTLPIEASSICSIMEAKLKTHSTMRVSWRFGGAH